MIAQLTGTVLQVGPTSAVIEVGGLGVLALCGPDTTASLRVGERATLATSLVVREDSLTLYGFASHDEREFFELLQTATGRGPEAGAGRPRRAHPRRPAQRDRDREPVQLVKVPGIGRKGAQRLVIELKDKINLTRLSDEVARPAGAPAAWREQVSQGLQGLGWSARDAEAACAEVEPMVAGDPELSVAVIMRAALQTLAREVERT